MKGAARRDRFTDIPLVGRTTEFQKLTTGWEEAKRGKAQFFIVAGEPGVGKTRLATELARHIQPEGEILVGRSSEVGMTLPYRIFTEPLKEFFKKALDNTVDIHTLVGSRPTAVAEFIPAIAEAGFEPESPVETTAEGTKYRLFEELARIFVNISRRMPLLLILDDLQWTGALSREFLDYFVRRIAGEKIFICATWRQEGTADPPRFERTDIIDLRGFDYQEIRNFLTATLGTPDIPQDFARHIYRESGGNPLYVQEIVKSLMESGTLKFENGWRFPDLLHQSLPSTITGIVTKRLARLDQQTREILATAALVGQQFSFDILLQITGRDEDRITSVIERALAALILREEPSILEMKYGFVHDLIHRALVDSIPADTRSRLHEQIAVTLETMYRYRLDNILADLAFHYARTPNRAKAFEYLMRAGDYASEHYANEEAIEFYAAALEMTERKQKPAEQLGLIHKRIGKIDEAIKHYELALHHATEPEGKAQILGELGEINIKQGRYAEAHQLIQNGLALLGDRSLPLKAHLFCNLACICYFKGDFDQARSLCSRALEEPLIDEQRTGDAYNIFALTDLARGELEPALRHYHQALDIFERLGKIIGVATINNNIANIYLIRGEFATAIRYLLKTLDTAEKVDDPYQEIMSAFNLGEIYTMLNDLPRAGDYYERARARCARINYPIGCGWVSEGLGRLFLSKAEYATAEEYFRKALETYRRLGSSDREHSTLLSMADMYLEQKRFEEAAPLVEKVIDYAETAHAAALQSAALLPRAKLCLGDPKQWGKARACIETSIALSMDDKTILISAYDQLARLSLLEHQYPEAAAAAKKAGAIIRSISDNLPEGEMRDNFLARRDLQAIQKLGRELESGAN